MEELVKKFEQAIYDSNITEASSILTELHNNWDCIDEEMQGEINNLEPVYLTLVKVAVQNLE